jgi:N-methylhydantoinase A
MRIGVEIGGTFTDLITVTASNTVLRAKVPSTPEDLSVGVLEALTTAVGRDLGGIDEVVHGSTVATNAILERKGARLGLLTTKGFRDVLLIQRQEREDIYDLFYRKPEALVSRDCSREVTERLTADGQVAEPLDEEELVRVVGDLLDEQSLDLLVISFVFGYLNPVHERRARAILQDAFPALPVVLASEIAPIFREYERTSTTAIAAYVGPVVERYLTSVEDRLRTEGFGGQLVIMQSNGGLLPAPAAAEQPAQMLNSGPAAGVIGAVAAAEELGVTDVITLDTGGTSTDVCLISGGAPHVTAARQVDGLPLHVESMDVVSVGAGGGSIAWRDAGGLLRVGPRSAGASPGPACYGRGGTEPTVTDALVVLGWLRPEQFLGGDMVLDVSAARTAIEQLGATVGMSLEETADGIMRLAVANMTEAMRLVSISRGHDPRDYALLAYGGAGGLHAAFVAEELNISQIIVPPNAGVFSAYGLLVADFRRDYQETRFSELSATSEADVRAVFDSLAERAAQDFTAHGIAFDAVSHQLSLDLRYRGQGYELTVEVTEDDLGEVELRERFADTHRARYGNAGVGGEIEIVTYRLSAVAPRARQRVAQANGASRSADAGRIYLAGAWRACTFVRGEQLTAGEELIGPSVVEEQTSTTIIPPGWRGTVHGSGSLVMEVLRDEA